MGVAHLISHLRPYASRDEEFAGENVVIDGPGFAYHIYHICLGLNQNARNPFQAIPSYQLLGQTAASWLDEFQSCGISLKKIYFDGYLPVSKRETRISRLLSYTQQASNYYEAWPQLIPNKAVPEASKTSPRDLFGNRIVLTRFTQIPAAPFLVPAIIEALLSSSSYSHMVEVVPGEADLYCASYLRQHGGVVLTGDSDLLVHDLGNSGAVAFFRDLQLVSHGRPSMKGVQYKTAAITKRLGLPISHGIRSLGFEMFLDAHATFPQLLQRATSLTAVRAQAIMYESFVAQYAPLSSEQVHPGESPLGGSIYANSLQQIQRLDPRISEYILRFAVRTSIKTIDPEMTGDFNGIDVFLPFLVDCPARTSAWEMSTSMRLVSYGLMNLIMLEKDEITTVMEHRRLQHGNQGRLWQIPSRVELQEACISLVELVTGLKKHGNKFSNIAQWRVLGLYQNLHWASSINKDALCNKLIDVKSKSSATTDRLNWDKIHFLAQLQGSYYSFRMLKQTLSVLMPSSGSFTLFPALIELQKELDTLPSLSEIWTFDEAMHWLASSEAKTELAAASKLLGIEDSNKTEPVTESKKSKKKRKRVAAAQSTEQPPKRPANLFELLGNG